MEKYKDYVIYYDPPPIPIRTMDWQWHHEDYDGAPMYSLDECAADNRCGSSASLEEAKADIDEMYEMHPEWHNE